MTIVSLRSIPAALALAWLILLQAAVLWVASAVVLQPAMVNLMLKDLKQQAAALRLAEQVLLSPALRETSCCSFLSLALR